MPTYLWQAKYTAEGTRGLIKEGGSARKAAVEQMVKKAGGKLLGFYYALGETDVWGITEFPDEASGLAMSLAINASGMVTIRSTQLIAPEQLDAAAKKSVGYRAPGA